MSDSGGITKDRVRDFLRRFHLALTVVWFGLVPPTIVWWRSSIPWLAFMSVWANVISHFSAYMAARAEEG